MNPDTCSGPLPAMSAVCQCGCGVYGPGVHVVRRMTEGKYGEAVSEAKAYAPGCCPVCPKEAAR